MEMTDEQAYVLDNIERVEGLKRKASAPLPLRRYQLDGQDCSGQIRALLVQARIFRLPGGRVGRVDNSVDSKAN